MRWIPTLLILLLAACSRTDSPQKRDPHTLIRITEAESRGLDPQMVSDLASVRINSDLFEGLTRFNAAGEAEAGLAERWSVSTDGKIWTFALRPNLKFSDGASVSADVFVKALTRIRDEKAGSPHTALFDIIEHIEASNTRTAIVYLKFPFPQLPALLAHPAMAALPFHRIAAKGAAWTSDRPLVSSGAYRLTNWELNQQMTLSTNPHWNGGRPATAKLIWKPMDNMQSSMRLMLSGGADIATDFPANRLPWLKTHYPKLVHNSGFIATYYFAFNTRRPPFNDPRVRTALSMAVDRQWMADNMIAAGNEPAWGLLPSQLRAAPAYRPIWASWSKSQRLAEARRLLKAAGYGPEKPLRFEVRFNSSTEHRRATVAMATMWRDIGVEASMLNSEASLHFDSLKRADFTMARSGWIADLPAPENFLAVHRSDTGAQNYSGYANPLYDAALDAALAEPDPVARAAKMRAAEEILMRDSPILPLYFYVSRALVQPSVQGWVDNVANVHPSRTLSIVRK
jgi:oligopeptide transport system substrate-binding protein